MRIAFTERYSPEKPPAFRTAVVMSNNYGWQGGKFYRTNGEVRPKSEEKKLFQRKICYRTVKVEIRRQEQKLCGVFPWQRRPQNHFLTVVAKAAA